MDTNLRVINACKGTKAFTLVELSIVLVILGLLAGGVVAGQDMIYAAKLRKVPVAIEKLRKDMTFFYDKYHALPGDFENAEAYWGTDPDGCPSHSNRIPKTETCNGNGDAVVGHNATHEFYRFWQHMKNAGLADGDFTGITGAGVAPHLVVGENVPVIYENIGIGVYHKLPHSGDQWLPDSDYGQVIVVGESKTGYENAGGFLSPEDTWSLDSKVDDGKPMTGDFLGVVYPHCSDAADWDSDDFEADYNMEETERRCSIYIVNAFPGNRR